MEYYHAIIFLLFIAIAMSAIAPKIKIPYPIVLMAAGIIVGFIPIPEFNYLPIEPEVVFLLVLPPLLYDAAVNISFREFKTNIRTISMMAIPLVFITMCAIAIIVHYLIPGLSWPMAFVVGAILSPPDAIAAAGITKGLNLSHRTDIILEGESLINDASALTAYRVALGVVTGGTFVFWEAGLEFIITLLGGCIIGFIMAFVFSYTLKRVKLESTAIVSLNLLLPFVAYQLAESLKVSGVLAVVTMGILIAKRIHKDKIFSDITKVQSKSLWSTIIYLLSGLVFILIGLELPQVLHEVPSNAIIPLVISAFAIFIIALLIRFIIVFRHKFKLDRIITNIANHKHSISEEKAKRLEEIEPLCWKEALIISWAGMRGIVSLATAIGLPVTLSNGETFTQRNTIIILTVLVVIIMMVIQGLGLPLLVKWLKVDVDVNKVIQEEEKKAL